MENREVTKEITVNSMMDGFDLRREPWPWYKTFFMKVKWKYQDVEYWLRKKRQKWITGFPHEESWSFNHCHANYVIPRLKHMRDNFEGIPSEMFPDDYDHYKEWEMDEEERDLAHEKARRRWYDTLTKIIWTFDNWDNHKEPIYPEDYDHRQKMTEYADGSTGFEGLDDRSPDYTPQEEHDKKIDEGLQLFVKYYHNLWH